MVEIEINFQELIAKKDWKNLKRELNGYDPFHIAEIIEDLEEQEAIILFRLLSREQAKETFQFLSHEKQEEIVVGLAHNINKITSLLNDLDPDDRTAFFEELPAEITQRLIQLLSPEERRIATQLLGYPEDSIGRLMTPEFVAVRPDFTVEQTLDHIRKHGKDSETLNVVYIIDKNWKLIDDIRIREIILADPGQKISELMDNRFVALNAFDDQELAIGVFRDHDRVALPVTDTEGKLIGIVTIDDVMDVAEEEITEDFHKFGSFQDAIINFWLTFLVFMNIFSGAALAHFENTIQAMVSLLFFLPLLIASSGNAGAQSSGTGFGFWAGNFWFLSCWELPWPSGSA